MSSLNDNLKSVVLTNDDKSLTLEIGFYGYNYEMIEKYLKEKFIECEKPYTFKWTGMKYF